MIPLIEYQKRRHHLAMSLPKDAIAVIPAASETVRNGDAHYRFRQDSDFYYLTGFNEPEALLLITGGRESVSILFNRARDPLQEQWVGRRLGQDEALTTLGVDEAYPLSSLQEQLPELLSGKRTIYYSMGRYPHWEKQLFKAWQTVKGKIRQGIVAAESFTDLAPIMGEMRLFKSPAEIVLMQKAAQISVAAHLRAIQSCNKASHEYQLQAELLYEFTRQGAINVAYEPIVAAGANACVLHYTKNDAPLRRGDLVLIDAGCEFENYAADITRTIPLSGRFSPEQRLIYDLVLRAQSAGIAAVKPGVPWNAIQQTMVHILTEGLVDLEILQGTVDELIEQEAYKPFYMHGSGHWLGLDVHDSGSYKTEGLWRSLEPGMVLTVEPGLYFSPTLSHIDSRWLGIGVRIEDDIQVTKEGGVNLSKELPVAIDSLEALVRG